jgi:hypothetical protein
MQDKKNINNPDIIPEYYLFWTLAHPGLLKKILRTTEGELISLLNLPAPNPDNGPDFVDAVIRLGEVQMRGDIECHINWQDWYNHGHDSDRRYSRVILHVLWNKPQQLPEELKGKFPHLILSLNLAVSLPAWLKFMKQFQEDYPFAPGMSRLPAFTEKDLRKLAWRRNQRKQAEIRSWTERFDWETAVYLGVARVLGYSKNSSPFVELVCQLPPSRLLASIHPLQRSPLIFWTLLAWQGGLLERPLRSRESIQNEFWYRFVFHVKKQLSHLLSSRRQTILQWNFSRLRPFNSPYYRLAGYAQILFHYQGQSLFQRLLEVFMQRYPLAQLCRKVENIFCLPLSVEFHPVFSQLLGFSSLPRNSMGSQRCHLLILNVLLPLFQVWAHLHQHTGFYWYLEDLYYNFPVVEAHAGVDATALPSEQKAYHQQALLEFCQQNPKGQFTHSQK